VAKRSASELLRSGRLAGILLHPTSLPGRFGIGGLGAQARRFVELLAEARQRVWQVLPTGPSGRDLCPYVPMSSFAGNELLVDLEELLDEGLLSEDELPDVSFEDDHVSEPRVRAHHELVLRRAHTRLLAARGGDLRSGDVARREMERFAEKEKSWLADYTLYRAMHARTLAVAWPDWPRGASLRDPQVLDALREELRDEIDYHVFVQWLFDRQWQRLRAFANERGVLLFGDLPLYVGHDSVDVWMRSAAFQLDAEGAPAFRTGVPGDPAFPQGQLWGHPCYDWEAMAEDGYGYFVQRLAAMARQFDWVRIDHFRGLEAYWRIPAGATDATEGEWMPGPGAALFEAIRAQLGELPIIAEDLGHITGPVRRLLQRFELPGMVVMQFGWWRIGSGFHPLRHRVDRVIYTGTHDTNTTRGWFEDEISDRELRNFELWLGRRVDDPARDLIEVAYASPARIAIVPVQDWYSLGTEARMNVPGRVGDLWAWRLSEAQMRAWPGHEMARWSERFDRC
jgi:4-alpha-glucanotransferase